MKRIAIIGLGLIGGSMALALKRAEVANWEVVGYARRPEVAAKALSLGAVDRAEADLFSAVEGAHIVLLATPAMAIQGILARIAGGLAPGCIVTDTASTKAQVMKWAEELLPSSVSFIGGHPMAGKEASGIEAADAGLFQGCTYCMVPGRGAAREAIDEVVEVVKLVGAKPLFLDASEHDSLVAGISHLPLVLSAALVATTTKSPFWPMMARLAATGFRDLSRLASGNPGMSRDICLTNREPILRWIDEYIGELRRFRHLVSEDAIGLEEAFFRAREERERWLQGI